MRSSSSTTRAPARRARASRRTHRTSTSSGCPRTSASPAAPIPAPPPLPALRGVALLTPAAFPEPEWLERLPAAAEAHPEHSFFASRQVMADDPGLLDGAGDAYGVCGFAWRRDRGRPV